MKRKKEGERMISSGKKGGRKEWQKWGKDRIKRETGEEGRK